MTRTLNDAAASAVAALARANAKKRLRTIGQY
jgi:hypothetical protein